MGLGSAGLYAVVTMYARILVVEDDRTMAEVLLAYLRRAGYETNWAANGSEAYQLWQREHPDVVILDLMLPGCRAWSCSVGGGARRITPP